MNESDVHVLPAVPQAGDYPPTSSCGILTDQTPVARDDRELAGSYALALQQYLAEPAGPAVARAHELGRQALTAGLGVVEMASVHCRAFALTLTRPLGDAERARILEAAQRFFGEALAPFEIARRGSCEASVVLHRLNDLLEGQAKRIAFALHDEAAQLLASVHFSLADIARNLPAERAREIEAARALLDDIEDRLRHLAHELRPPLLDHIGLVPALEFLAGRVSKRRGLSVAVEAIVDRKLPATVETILYRIAQEALTNVAKHAKATHARISVLQAAHTVACSIRDNGIGLDASAVAAGTRLPGLGLLEIRERVEALGGVLRLRSNPPHGTDLTVEIPLNG